MSRTRKDHSYKRHPYYSHYRDDTELFSVEVTRKDWIGEGMVTYNSFYTMQLPTTKPKKPRHVDTEHHWMSTPSWWTRLVMNRPQRRAGRIWEHTAAHTAKEELDVLDTPSVSHKPHQYYW